MNSCGILWVLCVHIIFDVNVKILLIGSVDTYSVARLGYNGVI